jgi:trigger factor
MACAKGTTVNVTLENLGPCKKLVRIEIEAAAVDAAFETVTKDFMKLARIPGFRPGKAPRHLVTKAFESRINDEVRQKLLSEAFRDAVREHELEVVGRPDVEEIQCERGQAFQFAVTIETSPEFELPDYEGLLVQREVRLVTEEDVERALLLLQEQRTTYLDVERPVQLGDFVVVNYTGTCEGRPITELAPAARGLTEKKDFWLEVLPESFIPGFAPPLVGAVAGEKRTVELTFPADFVTPQVAGKPGSYEVEIVQVKEKAIPALDDAFAQAYGAQNVEELRAGVRRDLENELTFKQRRGTRDQLVRQLLQRVTCELPESVVTRETRNVVYDIVRDNTERGVSREAIDQQKDQIFSFASNNARERVKASFVLRRIALKEGIKTEPKEITQRVLMLAEQHNIKPEKLVKQLQERDGIREIEDQILSQKVLDLLEQKARFEDVLPSAGSPA